MSYVSIKSGFTDILTSLGYRELSENLEFDEAPETANHFFYVMKPEGVDTYTLTNKGLIGAYIIRLQVSYFNNTSSKRDVNFGSFETLISNISGVSDFKGFEEITFEDTENDVTIGTITFIAGSFSGC